MRSLKSRPPRKSSTLGEKAKSPYQLAKETRQSRSHEQPAQPRGPKEPQGIPDRRPRVPREGQGWARNVHILCTYQGTSADTAATLLGQESHKTVPATPAGVQGGGFQDGLSRKRRKGSKWKHYCHQNPLCWPHPKAGTQGEGMPNMAWSSNLGIL